MLVTFNSSTVASNTPSETSKSFQKVSTDTNFYTFSKKRSRNGCLTCKIRKKKCDEAKPKCSDCLRLDRECIWQDPKMSENDIRSLKNRVEKYESSHKTRKRRPKQTLGFSESTETGNSADDQNPNSPAEFHRMDQKPEQELFSTFKIVQVRQPNSDQRSTPLAKSPMNISFSEISSKKHNTPIPLIEEEPPSMDQSNALNSQYINFRGSETASPSDDLLLSPQFTGFSSIPSPTPSLSNLLRELTSCDSGKIELIDDDGNPVFECSSLNEPSKNQKAWEAFSPQHTSPLSNFRYSSPYLSSSSVVDHLPVQLNDIGLQLYSYYHDKLAKMICIAPQDENLYVKVFLPMAHKDAGVLYSIIAWAGFHLGGDWEKEGLKYADMALDHLQKEANSESDKFTTESLAVKDDKLLLTLANLLILCGAEICRGDVKNWSFYLSWGSKLINSYGGIFNFTDNKDKQWLISNFAYHDILASSTSERGTYFAVEDYEKLFRVNLGLDPLLGVSKSLYNLVGEVSTLALESKRLLQIELQESGDVEDHSYELVQRIVSRAKILEQKIDEAKPDPVDLMNLNSQDLEWQLTLFETFQLTAKLHLRQSILKINPSSLETQLLLHDLLKCLDIILNTPVEGGLCFPIFIAGITCITPQERMLMSDRFGNFIERYGCRNVDKARFIMEKVWMLNDTGDKIVDWYSVVKELDWDLSFA